MTQSPAITLRRAAALMRQRATHEAVPEESWYVEMDDDSGEECRVHASNADEPRLPWDVAREVPSRELAEHIASWHPAVTLAVADWLGGVAIALETGDPDDLLGFGETTAAFKVACAYLGEVPDGD